MTERRIYFFPDAPPVGGYVQPCLGIQSADGKSCEPFMPVGGKMRVTADANGEDTAEVFGLMDGIE